MNSCNWSILYLTVDTKFITSGEMKKDILIVGKIDQIYEMVLIMIYGRVKRLANKS